MNTIKVKKTIYCDICQCAMPRTKSFKVEADNMEDATAEVLPKVDLWVRSLRGKHCKVCKSVVDQVASEMEQELATNRSANPA